MPYIEGESRHQIHLLGRFSCSSHRLGFQVYSGIRAGQKRYHREDLLKLYLYFI